MYQFIKHTENKTKNWTSLLFCYLGPSKTISHEFCFSWPLAEHLPKLIFLQFPGLWLAPKDISFPMYLGSLLSYLLFLYSGKQKNHTLTNTLPSSSIFKSISWVSLPATILFLFPHDGLWPLSQLPHQPFCPQAGFLLALHIMKMTLVKVTIDLHDAKSNRHLCLFILFNLSLAFNPAGCCVFLEAHPFVCSVLLHIHACSLTSVSIQLLPPLLTPLVFCNLMTGLHHFLCILHQAWFTTLYCWLHADTSVLTSSALNTELYVMFKERNIKIFLLLASSNTEFLLKSKIHTHVFEFQLHTPT